MSTELSNATDYLKWVSTKAQLNNYADKAKTRVVNRGDVYWCHFGINIGSEISKTTPRPAVIIQNYNGNRVSSNIIVVPITHNSSKAPYLVPIVPIEDTISGKVVLDGSVNTANIICASKARLGDKIGKLSNADMRKIDKSIAQSIGLFPYYLKMQQKYEKLNEYCDKVKEDRNTAQDKIKKLEEELENLKKCLKKSQEKIDV